MELHAWVAHHRERLCFSDRFGGRWRLAPESLTPRASGTTDS